MAAQDGDGDVLTRQLQDQTILIPVFERYRE